MPITMENDLELTGGVLRICGRAMTPRVILMTDGQPTDAAGEIEVCDYQYHTIEESVTILSKLVTADDDYSSSKHRILWYNT